jgi:hypothetical protein
MAIHMEIKDIKHIIIKILRSIKSILKEIRTLPNVWLYIVLSVILTIVFFIFTFPYSALIRNQLQIIGESIGRSADIGDISFNLFTGAKIDNMTIVFKDGAEISFQNTELDMSIFSALISNTIKGYIRINNVKYGKDKTSINIVAKSDFNLKFNSMSEFPANGKIKLDLQNVIANGITIQGFDIPPVRFSSITADATILKKKITIEAFNASGPDIKGSISGFIMITQSFQQSQLNLNIVLDSSSPFLENYKVLLNKWIDSANKIQLTVRGSISNPNIDAQGQKNENSSNVDSRTESRVDPRVNPMEQRNSRKPALNPPPIRPQAAPQVIPQNIPNEPNVDINPDQQE